MIDRGQRAFERLEGHQSRDQLLLLKFNRAIRPFRCLIFSQRHDLNFRECGQVKKRWFVERTCLYQLRSTSLLEARIENTVLNNGCIAEFSCD
jgi:hypothetical protein